MHDLKGNLLVRISAYLKTVNWITLFSILVTVVLWASSFVGIRAALYDYSPGHLALLRYIVASIVLLVGCFWMPLRMPLRQDVPALIGLGFLGIALYNVALNYGEQTVPAGIASFLVNTAPVFTTLLAIIFLGEKIKKGGWVGIFTGFVGAAIISFSLAGDGQFTFNWGAALILLAALVQAIYFVIQKSFLERYKPLELTAYTIWGGTVCLFIYLPGLKESIQVAPIASTLAIVYLGVFPGVLGYVAYAYALSKMPASKVTNFLYLVPVTTLPLAWFWLGEWPGSVALLGGLIALAGVIVVTMKG
ncbi:MAG: DMT family transporter [Rhodothermales bacterium]